MNSTKLFNDNNLKLFSLDNFITNCKSYFFRNNDNEITQINQRVFYILLDMENIHPSATIEYKPIEDDDYEIHEDLNLPFILEGLDIRFNIVLCQPNQKDKIIIPNCRLEDFIDESFMEIDDSHLTIHDLNIYSKWE